MNIHYDKYYKYQEFLLDELTFIDSMFDLYIFLYNQHVTRVDVLNIAPAFFRLTENALLENASIRLSRLYDSNKNTITIRKFINYIEQNKKMIFEEESHSKVCETVKKNKIR